MKFNQMNLRNADFYFNQYQKSSIGFVINHTVKIIWILLLLNIYELISLKPINSINLI